ncbi:50S ribosomal protein L9 [Candidatus Dependentiae bacterium]|nr:50S ribosomal protein L9 [Candidatus Dependentiae bacterium]
MKVLLTKDIVQVGMAGDIVTVTEGYFRNYLLPHKLAIEVNERNESYIKNKMNVVERKKEAIETQTSMLAERIKSTQLVLKRKMHDDGKLYGAVNAHEVVDLLAEKGIKVGKSQIEFPKTIKEKGMFDVTIKLSSRLKPTLTLKVVAEAL